jgi:hypothetical protein
VLAGDGAVTAQRDAFRLGFRMTLRMGAPEAEPLKTYAREHSLSVSQAARRLIRSSLSTGRSALPEDDTERGALLEELVLMNLIISEQTLKLLETITPHGPGAADALLVEATQSVQRRLARDPVLEPAGTLNGLH